MSIEKEIRKYMTVDDVAYLLTVHPSTIYRYVANCSIPHIKMRGRVLFDQGDVQMWLKTMSISAK